MINALSIDLEDWFCANNITEAIGRSAWDSCELRVTGSTKSILEVLATHGTKATFFVLGWIAERVPELVDEIERQGHEIATHGYSHTLLTHMTPESFADDLGRALEVTKLGPDREIIGFRAPSFTLVDSTRWALDVMADLGIEYDSSMFPIGFHPDYGIPDAPLSVHRPTERIVEFPLSCA
ncbi:polysaccharide deacetylase family protein, partial [Candidatus Fermentibacterales bacterium]|nr:polysaccharide deacetylase family protein [Candidatus Fermentibacterales bacterium]